MSGENKPQSVRHRLPLGCGLGVIVGALAAGGLTVLIGRAWEACDVGINASANSFALLFVLPVLWMANSVLITIVFASVPGRTWRRDIIGILASLVALTLLAWFVFAWQGTPSDYPSPWCDNNVPPWWPSWLPA